MAFCGKCGRQIKGDACPFCDGARRPTNRITGYCGKCGKPVIDGQYICGHGGKGSGSRRDRRPGKKRGKKAARILLILLSLLLVLGGGLLYLRWPELSDRYEMQQEQKQSQRQRQQRQEEELERLRREVEQLEAEIAAPVTEYPEDNITAQEYELLSSEPLSSSFTEGQAVMQYAARGFADLEISASYDENGQLTEPVVISADSSQKHPEYYAVYESADGELWMLKLVTGSLSAYPMNYSITHANQPMVVYSESQHIKVFDEESGLVCELLAKDSSLRPRVVSKIEPAVLDALTREVIENG